MGKEYVILSFFKKEKIDYFYQPFKSIVTFPCPLCNSPVEMCLITSEWNCLLCNSKGNLLTLIKYVVDKSIDAKIYNPLRERKEILQQLNNLYISSKDEKFMTLMNKVDRIIEYYKKTSQ